MEYNFSFTNPVVKEFFEGDSKPTPALISMVQYLHVHPLIKESFLNEIAEEIAKTEQHLKKINFKSEEALKPLIAATIALSKNLPDENPSEGLLHLRTIRNECLLLQKLAPFHS